MPSIAWFRSKKGFPNLNRKLVHVVAFERQVLGGKMNLPSRGNRWPPGSTRELAELSENYRFYQLRVVKEHTKSEKIKTCKSGIIKIFLYTTTRVLYSHLLS